ncbi:MAG: MFS transporter [Planctomycetaceae bacterium]|nr:MFS transporter [Planctomycetaceae bacterium]
MQQNLSNNTPSPFYRWELLVLLFFTYFLHQADRAIFAVVLPLIRYDLNLTDSQLGLSGTVLFLVIAVMVPIAGFIGDRCSKKWIITCSLVFWSAATMLTGLSRGLAGIIMFRSVATGGGESFYGPAATALIAAFHQKTRALALSIHQGSLYFGVMLSGFLGAWVAELYGWRATFYIFGGIGILLGVVLVFRLRDPSRNEQGNTETAAQAESIPPWEAVKKLARIPTVWLLTAGFTAIVFVNNAYMVWAPTFIMKKFEVPLMTAAGFSMFYHHITALLGVLLGGAIADALVPRIPTFRLRLQAASMLCGVPLVFLLGRIDSLLGLWIIIALFGFVRGLYESNTHAAVFDVVPQHLRATVVGGMIMCGFLIGSLSPLLLGMLGDRYGTAAGLGFGFSCLSLAWLIGGLCVAAVLFVTFKRDRLKE